MKVCFKCFAEKPLSDFYVHKAMADGKLQRKTVCEHCNLEKKLQKHHWSYEEQHWLDVIWLCTSCHGKEHKKLNSIGRNPDTISE